MQKADSLMRSNRNVGVTLPDHGAQGDQGIPVLTDIVIAGDAMVLRQHQTVPAPHDTAPATLSDEARQLADQVAKEQARMESDKLELAEAVYFEVLRDLDIDSGEGMHERLSAQLMPLFERMGRDLVIRAEQALGEAIRDQVAAAIERKLGVPPASHKRDTGEAEPPRL